MSSERRRKRGRKPKREAPPAARGPAQGTGARVLGRRRRRPWRGGRRDRPDPQGGRRLTRAGPAEGPRRSRRDAPAGGRARGARGDRHPRQAGQRTGRDALLVPARRQNDRQGRLVLPLQAPWRRHRGPRRRGRGGPLDPPGEAAKELSHDAEREMVTLAIAYLDKDR